MVVIVAAVGTVAAVALTLAIAPAVLATQLAGQDRGIAFVRHERRDDHVARHRRVDATAILVWLDTVTADDGSFDTGTDRCRHRRRR